MNLEKNIQLYEDRNKQIKIFPKTYDSNVIIDENTTLKDYLLKNDKFDNVVSATDENGITTLTFYANGEVKNTIEIATSAGGGPLVTLESALEDNLLISENESLILPYSYMSNVYGSAILHVTISCGTSSKDLEFEIQNVGSGVVNLGTLTKGSNIISAYITDPGGRTSNFVIRNVKCGKLEVLCSFDQFRDYKTTDEIRFPITIKNINNNDLSLIITIDGSEFRTNAVIGYNSYLYPASKKTVGAHAVTIQAISSDNSMSNILNYTVCIVDEGSILISTETTTISAEEGTTFSIPFRVSSQGISLFRAVYYIDGREYSIEQIEVGVNEFISSSSTFSAGTHTFRVVVSTLDQSISTYMQYTVDIAAVSFEQVSYVTTGLEAFFDMSMKSNSDPNRTILNSKVKNSLGTYYTLKLNNYNFESNGWIDSKLVTNSGAYAEIDYAPLENNVKNGFTFDISFKSDYNGIDEGKIINCYDGNKGFYIDNLNCNICTESNRLSTPFSKNEETRITIVVNRDATYREEFIYDENGFPSENPSPSNKKCPMIQCYINGVLSEVAMLSDSGTGLNKKYEAINNTSKIYIALPSKDSASGNSNSEIKNIAIYSRALSSEEVVQNLLASIDDINEQEERFELNNSENAVPSIYLSDTEFNTCNQINTISNSWINIKYITNGSIEYGKSFEYLCKIKIDETSNPTHPFDSYKMELYDYERDSEGNPINVNITESFKEKMINPFGFLDGNGYDDNKFTLNSDYIDSSHARNTGLSRFINDIVFQGNSNPAKQVDSMVRETITGFPCKLYVNNKFYGIYNFNYDNSSLRTFGYDKDDGIVKWNIKSQKSAGRFVANWTVGGTPSSYENDLISIEQSILADFEIEYNKEAFENRTGSYDISDYLDELGIYRTSTVMGSYREYAILSLARAIQFVTLSINDRLQFRNSLSSYFNVERACRYFINSMVLGAFNSLNDGLSLTMYGDNIWWCNYNNLDDSLSLNENGLRIHNLETEYDNETLIFNELFKCIDNYLINEVSNSYLNLRNGVYTLENLNKYLFEKQIKHIPENLYNLDMETKYISQGGRYLHLLHGSEINYIKRWLYKSLLYMDSVYIPKESPYTRKNISITSNKPISGEGLNDLTYGVQYKAIFYIETYNSQYINISVNGSENDKVFIPKGEVVKVSLPMINTANNNIIIYSAENIKNLGSFESINPSSMDISEAINLLSLNCNNCPELLSLNIENNILLSSLNLNGCASLGLLNGTSALNVSNNINLTDINAFSTQYKEIVTNERGSSLVRIIFPESITSINLSNMNSLINVGIPYNNEGMECKDLRSVTIKNCQNIERLAYPDYYSEELDLSPFKWVKNLTIDNCFHVMVMFFNGLYGLENLTLRNLTSLIEISFVDMLNNEGSPILGNVSINNCPLLERLEMRVTSNSSVIAFKGNSTLDLRYLPSLKTIYANTPVIGLENIYLNSNVKEIIFDREYNSDNSSDIKNIWVSSNIEKNINESFQGIDLEGMIIKNIKLESLSLILNCKNMYMIPEELLSLGLFQSDNDIKRIISGTLDLNNFISNELVSTFANTDISNLLLISSKDVSISNLSNTFFNAKVVGFDLNKLFNNMINVERCDSAFTGSDVNRFYIPKQVTDNFTMDSMYSDTYNLKNLNILDTVKCFSAKGLFRGSALIDIENFNIEASDTIFEIFATTNSLNTINNLSINSPNCTSLFSNSNLNTINNLNFGNNCKDISSAFLNCINLTEDIEIPTHIEKCDNIFKDCVNMTHIRSNWDNPFITNISSEGAYSGCNKITYIDDTLVVTDVSPNGLDSVPVEWGGLGFPSDTTNYNTFEIPSDGYTLNLRVEELHSDILNPLTDWGDGTINNELVHTYVKSGEYLVKTNYQLAGNGFEGSSTYRAWLKESWPSKYANTFKMFSLCNNLTRVHLNNMREEVKSLTGGIEVNNSIEWIDVTNSTLNDENMFMKLNKLSTIIGLDKVTIKNGKSLFEECNSLINVDLKGSIFSQCNTFEKMFYNCSMLKSIDMENCDVSRVSNMSNIFAKCPSLISVNMNGWKTLNLENLNYAFSECSKIQKVLISHLNTSSVTSMTHMFDKCFLLTEVDLNGLDLNKVIDMKYAFNDCGSLLEVPIHVIPDSVEDISYLFNNCVSLTNINGMTIGSGIKQYTSWLPTSIKYANNLTIKSNINFMNFNKLIECNNLTITNNVTTLRSFFENCTNLASFTLNKHHSDLSKVTDLSLFIANNKLINTLDFSDLVLTSLVNLGSEEGSSMIKNTNVNYLNFSDCTFGNVTLDSLVLLDGSTASEITISFNNSKMPKLRLTRPNLNASTMINLDFVNADFEYETDFINRFQNDYFNLKSIDLTAAILSHIANFNGMFKNNTTMISDIKIPNTAVNVSEMFMNCTAITHINSNWNNEYEYGITSNDCYKGCSSITHIDNTNVIDSLNTVGLDSIPREWGGNGFSKESTSYNKFLISSDGYRLDFTGSSVQGVSDLLTDWGDGNIDNLLYHTYNNAGTYLVKTNYLISGNGNPPSTSTRDTLIEAWIPPFANTDSMFEGCNKLTRIHLDGCNNITRLIGNDTTNNTITWIDVTDAKLGDSAFCNLNSLTTIVGLDKAIIINGNSLFKECRSLSSLDLTNTKIDNLCTTFREMFNNCINLTEILGIRNFNTINITDIQSIFMGCSKLLELDLSEWNVRSITVAINAFSGCTALEKLNLSGWSLNGANSMNSFLLNCSSLKDLIGIEMLNPSSSTSMINLFENCSSLTSLNLKNWNVSSVTNMSFMFRGCTKLVNVDISEWNVNSLNSMESMFRDCSALSNLNIKNWINSNNVTSIYATFMGCTSITTIDMTGFNFENVESTGLMFSGCSSLTEVIGLDTIDPISSKLVTMTNMFASTGLEKIKNLVIPDTVTNIDSIFGNCNKLISMENVYFGKGINNINAWKPLNLKDVVSITIATNAKLFTGITSLTNVENCIISSSVTDMSNFFSQTGLVNFSLSSESDLSNVTKIDNMFQGCTKLNKVELDYSKFGSALRSMNEFMSNCNDAPLGELSPIIIPDSVTSVTNMLYNCYNLSSIDNFVFGSGINECSGIFTGLGNFTANNIEIRNNVIKFTGLDVTECKNLTLSDNVNTINTMFQSCTKLEETSVLYSKNITDLASAFEGCTSLKKVKLGELSNNMIDLYRIFKNCNSLKNIEFYDKIMTIDTSRYVESAFGGCSSLTTLKNFKINLDFSIIVFENYINNNAGAMTSINTIWSNCTNIVNTPGMGIYNNGARVFFYGYKGNISEFIIGSQVTDISYTFRNCPNITKDIVIPSHVMEVTQMYRGCYNLKDIHSNWNNTFNSSITTTDCYRECYGISSIDGEEINSEYLRGIDYVPQNWGGSGFDLDHTTIYILNTSLGNSLTINLGSFYNSQYINVDWGDNTGVNTNNTHTYSQHGIYAVKVRGLFYGSDRNSDDSVDLLPQATKDLIINIPMVSKYTKYQSDEFIISNLNHAFDNFVNVNTIDISNWASLQPTTMNSLFKGCNSLVNIVGLESLDTSKVENMKGCFSNISLLRTLNLSSWNTSSLKDMSYMFDNCSLLNTLNLENFDVRFVTNMNYAFRNCILLNEITGISNFSTSNLTYMEGVFESCKSLISLDLSKWTVNRVLSAKSLFKNCTKLNEIILTALNFDSLNISDDSSKELFLNCSSLRQNPYSQLANLNKFYTIDLRGCSSLPAILNFNDIPLRETKIIHLPENVVEVIRLNPILPCNISFKDRTLLKKIENVYFDSSIEYGYWYYGGGESPMHVRFTGEILNPTASKESYVNGFAVMDEASKTDFLEHLKDYRDDNTTNARLLGVAQYLTQAQILIAVNKNWTIT